MLGKPLPDSPKEPARGFGKCGERGERDTGKEYLRAPNGVHWARAARRAWRVDSLIVDIGGLEMKLPFRDRGVSGPRFIGGWKP